MKNIDPKAPSIEVDLRSQKRNRTIIISVFVINFLVQISPFFIVGSYMVGKFSPTAEQLGGFFGTYLATSLFYLLGYRLGRGQLQATWEENKKKFTRGIWGIIICVVFSLLVLIQNTANKIY